ncbi:MAG: cytochrome bc complex cytochrome b subunit [Elusimicrobia bacterium]|nr:cytochrome bc complex cytochrome b subunit [Elusimicrobiota bacterium]
MPTLDIDKIKQEVVDSQIWRAVFRGGVWSDTPRDRQAHISGNVWLHLHPAKVRPRALKWTYTWGLGGLSFALFLLLALSGVLLMFYYRPVPGLAFRDIKDLTYAVSMGRFLRNLHRWAAQAMVVAVIAHMVRVFLTGAYKRPREFNWSVGVLLLTLTLFLSFTGYLLPWDQLAFWAVTVGTNMAGATPLLGNSGPFSGLLGMHVNNDLRFVMLGGTSVGANTLLRFYVLHTIAVPLLVGILLILHFWRVRKDSFSAAPYQANEAKVDVWPNLVKREYIAAVALVIFIMFWAITKSAPLETIADPNVTMNPEKAPWYFAGLQEMLVYFDPWLAGVLVPNLIIVGLMAVPFIDTNPKGVGYYAWKERPFAITMFLLGVVMWFSLMAMGVFFRGPNYAWYWPWESWWTFKAAPPPTWNVFGPHGQAVLPLALGVPVLGGLFLAAMLLPKLIQRDLNGWKVLGGVLLATAALGAVGAGMGKFTGTQVGFLLFFAGMTTWFGFVMPQRHIRRLDWARYLVTMALVVSTMGILLKMGARLCFNIKYVMTVPVVSMNI